MRQFPGPSSHQRRHVRWADGTLPTEGFGTPMDLLDPTPALDALRSTDLFTVPDSA